MAYRPVLQTMDPWLITFYENAPEGAHLVAARGMGLSDKKKYMLFLALTRC